MPTIKFIALSTQAHTVLTLVQSFLEIWVYSYDKLHNIFPADISVWTSVCNYHLKMNNGNYIFPFFFWTPLPYPLVTLSHQPSTSLLSLHL